SLSHSAPSATFFRSSPPATRTRTLVMRPYPLWPLHGARRAGSRRAYTQCHMRRLGRDNALETSRGLAAEQRHADKELDPSPERRSEEHTSELQSRDN